ncbi:TRAP transporter small permease [Halalkalibacter krulwichiae]|uniref:Sialic acid TRAP transporter permease protein SiaT n=1 Tax=Halalkalibacter krulwichiae TaxID=199441 RepID=A0A1X9M8G3_9BACI|nr:TRAP transporter small permease [Halalkalibacter krulwichiae]ARK29739.1 Sialic acid TRAP transporter permease protein SiaT [Halalkalibacter krulwichiae]
MKTLKMVRDGLTRLQLGFSLILLTLMTLSIIYQVFSRQVLGTAPAWTEQLSKLLFVWVSFMGIAYGFKAKLHIGVGLFVGMLPEKLQDVFDYIAKGLIILFGVVLVYYGMEFTILMNNSTIPGLGITSSVLYAAIPVTGFFVLLYGVELLFKKGLHEKYDDVSEE